jgi:hypothetical protein
MWTGGLYRGVPHDRHRNAVYNFQIGVSRGRRTASRGLLARVPQRLHMASSQPYAADCLLWSEQMEGFGGPRPASPTIAGLCAGVLRADPYNPVAIAAQALTGQALASIERRQGERTDITSSARLTKSGVLKALDLGSRAVTPLRSLVTNFPQHDRMRRETRN